jgi:hypothetical protein
MSKMVWSPGSGFMLHQPEKDGPQKVGPRKRLCVGRQGRKGTKVTGGGGKGKLVGFGCQVAVA